MSPHETCPTCSGVLLRDSSPGGHCPRCLLGLGLGVPGAGSTGGTGGTGRRSRGEIGGYGPVGLAGKGPHGVVYEAVDRAGRRLALKVFAVGPRPDDTVFDAWTAGRLAGPDVVEVVERGRENEREFLALAWCGGGSLDGWIRRRRSRGGDATREDVHRVLHWMRGAATTLTRLHDRGVVHANLKPGNLLIDDGGAVRLTDFGAPRRGAPLPPAPPDRPLQSVAYRAPEVLGGAEPDTTADVYALGAVMFEALTGALPCDATDEESYVDAICAGRLVPARTRRGHNPRELDTLLRSCLAANPSDRPDALTLTTRLTTPRPGFFQRLLEGVKSWQEP